MRLLSEIIPSRLRKKLVFWHNWTPWDFSLLAAIICYSAFFSIYLEQKYDYYRTGYFDFGQSVQTIWLAAHGRFNALALGRPISIVSALPYLLFPMPLTLLVFQSIVLGSGALPVYLLAIRELKSPRYAFAMGVLYLAYAPLWGVNLYEYHDLAFSITFLLFTMLFYQTRNLGGFAVSLLLGLFSSPFVIVIGAAIFVWILLEFLTSKHLCSRGDLRFVTAAGALTLVFALYLETIPFLPLYEVSSLSTGSYTFTGSTAIVDPAAALSQPFYTISYEGLAKILYLVEMLGPMLFLPVLAIRKFLPALPWVAVIIADSPGVSLSIGRVYILTQWSTFIIPFIFTATIFGVKRLAGSSHCLGISITPGKLIGLMFVASAIVAIFAGGLSPLSSPQIFSVGDTTIPNDYAGNSLFHNIFPVPVRDSDVLDRFVNSIPPNYSVLTQNQIGSKLGERFPNVWTYYQPGYGDVNADAILVDYNIQGLCANCLSRALASGNYYLFSSYDSGKIYLYFRIGL